MEKEKSKQNTKIGILNKILILTSIFLLSDGLDNGAANKISN